ncbi:ribosome-inactivating family protein [Streptomyces sp. NPDC050982]|uniref:ribosome-inactivating family protein n=1 Tax=Streptomyces sp. NPDC050982 TaxID=3154746 RepID=UPI0034087F8E
MTIRIFSHKALRTTAVSAAVGSALLIAVAGTNGQTATHSTALGQTQLVSSTTPTDGMSYDMSTTDWGQFADRYSAVINDIRNRLRTTPLYGNMRLSQRTNDYFPVTLAMGRSQITLVINARNLYVVGWRNEGTNTYYRLNEGPGTFGTARTVNLPWLNYNDMEAAAGTSRANLNISMGTLQGSISTLGSLNNISNSDRARSLLIVTQAIAEGARFDFISYRIDGVMRRGNSWNPSVSSTVSSNGASSSTINVTGLDLENNWARLSDSVVAALNDGRPPHVRIGSGYLDTLSAIDAQVAIALSS